jgi:hypothetical protein
MPLRVSDPLVLEYVPNVAAEVPSFGLGCEERFVHLNRYIKVAVDSPFAEPEIELPYFGPVRSTGEEARLYCFPFHCRDHAHTWPA